MTLRQVGLASQGRFKSTAVAGYERAERSITLERFYELARLYDMVPERLLSQIAWRVADGPDPMIDLSKIDLPAAEGAGRADGVHLAGPADAWDAR